MRTLDQWDALRSILASAEGYPAEVVEALAAAAHVCRSVAQKGVQHKHQTTLMEMIAEVLTSMRLRWTSKLATARAQLHDLELERARLSDAYQVAEAAVTQHGDAMFCAGSAWSAAAAALVTSAEALASAEQFDRKWRRRLTTCHRKKASLDVACTALWTLRYKEPSVRAWLIKGVMKAGRECKLNEKLLRSGLESFAKSIQERYAADRLTFHTFDQKLHAALSERIDKLGLAAQTRTESAAGVAGAKASNHRAAEKEAACKARLDTERQRLKEAEAAKEVAEAALDKLLGDLSVALKSLKEADAKVRSFEGALACLLQLATGLPSLALEERLKSMGARSCPNGSPKSGAR